MHDDPIALTRAAIEAMGREDWHAVVALCDPVSLTAFQRQLVEQFERVTPQQEITAEEFLRLQPDIPREVIEYQMAQHAASSDPDRRLREELPGVPDVAALKAMSAEGVFEAWLYGRSPRRQMERLAAEAKIALQAEALAATEALAPDRYVVLGGIEDGDRVTHVLYRMHYDGGSDWQGDLKLWLARRPPGEQELARELSGRLHPQIASCRRQPNGGWLLLAGQEFLTLGLAVGMSVWRAS